MFNYREFIKEHNPNAKIDQFSRSTTPGLIRTETPGTGRLPTPAPDTLSESHNQSMLGYAIYEDPKLSKLNSNVFMIAYIGIIKNKLKNYITKLDITLSSLFQLIDTNSDQTLSLNEFLQKMKALETKLDDSELRMLF